MRGWKPTCPPNPGPGYVRHPAREVGDHAAAGYRPTGLAAVKVSVALSIQLNRRRWAARTTHENTGVAWPALFGE